MEAPFLATLAVTGAAMVYWYWLHHVLNVPTMSADTWHMRNYAFTELPVSAPYCWRPLVPHLARHLGFKPIAFVATFATPALIYFVAGGGWVGFAVAMLFVGNSHLLQFNVRSPEYTESLGQLLFIASLWAVGAGSPLAWPLLLLAALCRETLTATLGLIVLFWNPVLLVPLVAGAAVSYFTANREQVNRHPLVEASVVDTIRKWAKYKGAGVISYSHIVQPFRGLAFAVPFVWQGVGDFARLGLVGFIGIWLLAIPATGQSRILCYGFGLLIPFAATLPLEWLWVFVFASWFWPIDLQSFDETGGQKSFGFAR